MAAKIAPRPAVESPRRHRGHVVGHQIRPQLIALIDRGPQLAALRVPGQPDGISQARGIDPPLARRRVDLQDRRPLDLLVQAVLADVGVRAHPDIQPRPVGTGHQALGPVVVPPGRQVRHLHSRSVDPRLTGLVREGHHRIGVGDVKPVADQHHAERRCQALNEGRLQLRDPVPIRVSQQGDAVGARRLGPRLLHEQALDPTPDAALLAFRLRRSVRFRHQDVTVGQAIEPARMIQSAGKDLDPQPFGRHRRPPLGPAHAFSHVHLRHQRPRRRRQDRIRPEPGLRRQRRWPSARRQRQGSG